MKKKSYKLTFGLNEGYAKSGRAHILRSAGELIRDWMTGRLAAKAPIVTGLLQEGILFFPAVNDQEMVTASPSAVFTGELSTADDLRRSDKEVKRRWNHWPGH